MNASPSRRSGRRYSRPSGNRRLGGWLADERAETTLRRTDSVPDVADIDRYADVIGDDVTKVRIAGGVHDVVLSRKPVRENKYRELFQWLRSRDI